MPTITTEEAVLSYLQKGKGPDIVWVPGGDMRGEEWRDQFTEFERDFRNTSFDPRGVGETKHLVPPPWSIADFARDCAAVIREACSPPVFIIGLSMGGMIVEQVALDFPELIRCAIPMGTTAKPTGYGREWMQAEVDFRRAGGQLTKEFAVAHYGVYMYPSEVLGDDELWAKVKPFVSGDYGDRDGEMLAAQWQACIDFDVVDRLPKCQVPMHVIGFSQDVQAPPSNGKRVSDLTPDGHFYLLEGLGHLSVHGHKPEVVNACIREIVESFL